MEFWEIERIILSDGRKFKNAKGSHFIMSIPKNLEKSQFLIILATLIPELSGPYQNKQGFSACR